MRKPGVDREVLRGRPRSRWAVAVLVAAATLAAFLPTLGNGFVDWDDTRNFLENPYYRGLGWAQLRWMATSSQVGHWVPLTWLTLGLDYVLWGMNPAGYHLTSLLIHAGATVTLFAVARALIERAAVLRPGAVTAGAAAAALLFGLHPLRVESVAWATERRDVLAGLFFLLTVLAYVRAASAHGARRAVLLGGSLLAHAGALLSKSTVVMAPLVLLVLDVYPLRRRPPSGWLSGGAARLLAEKAPWVALSLVQGLVTYRFFRSDASLTTVPLPWPESVARVLVSLWAYPVKSLVPVGLSPLDEAPPMLGLLDRPVLVAASGVALLTALAWGARRRWPALGAAWAAYAVLLAPVAGVLPLGYHLTADRYSYVPCLAFAVLAGGGVAVAIDALASRGRRAVVALVVGAVGMAVLALGVTTWRQVHVWRDTASLWRHAVEVAPRCGVCRINHGHDLLAAGAPAAAVEQFRLAVALRPDRAEAYQSLGAGLEALGQRDEAVQWYRVGLAQRPWALPLRVALTAALLADGRADDAVETLHGAWRFYEPRGLVRYFEDAARHRPRAPVPRLGLVLGWLALGDRARARVEHDVLRGLHPGAAAAVRVD